MLLGPVAISGIPRYEAWPEAVRDARQLDPRQVPDAEISLSVMTDDRRPHDNRRRARNCRSAATSLEGVSRREADVLRLA